MHWCLRVKSLVEFGVFLGPSADEIDDQDGDEVAQHASSHDVDKAEHAEMPIELPD